ncbi:MAG: hypothetical protein QM770_00595 [Tepidisphaeraceae bacterium]
MKMGLALFELMLAIEKEFDFDFPDADASRICTTAQLADYICQRLGERGESPDRAAILVRVKQLVHEIDGIDTVLIHEDDDFIDDLGIDVEVIARWRARRRLKRRQAEST